MNNITVYGNIGQDPTDRGNFVTFSVASSYYDRGENKTQWYSISVFGQSAKYVLANAKKGMRCIVVGSLVKNGDYLNIAASRVEVIFNGKTENVEIDEDIPF